MPAAIVIKMGFDHYLLPSASADEIPLLIRALEGSCKLREIPSYEAGKYLDTPPEFVPDEPAPISVHSYPDGFVGEEPPKKLKPEARPKPLAIDDEDQPF